MQTFKRVVLYARQHRANFNVKDSLHKLVDYLHKIKLPTFLDIDTFTSFHLKLPILPRVEMNHNDLIIVVGGDGSLLSAARMAINANAAVIGINRGRLGFLTDISPHEIENELKKVLEGSYTEETRFLLSAQIHDEDILYFESNALNDVVLGRGNATHLIEFDVFINEQFVCHYRSDGIILATPTGSTAYALSAGGPIMHPKLNAIVIVPMCSHSLSSRPLVIDNKEEIHLHICINNETNLRLSCDGHESMLVKPGQIVSIKKNHHQLRLLHPLNYHYYDILRVKLGWESKHQG